MRGARREMNCAQLVYRDFSNPSPACTVREVGVIGWTLSYFDGAGHKQTLRVSESKDATPRELAAAVEAAIGVDSKLTGTIHIYQGAVLRGTIRIAEGEAKSWKSQRQGVAVKTKRADHGDQQKQHEAFVRDAIARSLLTLPFANLDAKDPFGTIYGYYKQLLESSTSSALPEAQVLMSLVELIRQDAAVHESVGNYLKADVERRWCEGMWLHFTWGQERTKS